MVRSKLFTAIAVAGAALTSPVYGDLVIDSFGSPEGGQFAQDNQDNEIPTWSSLDGLPVIGGAREVFVDKTAGSGFDQGIRGEVNGSNTDGIYAYDQFTSTFAGRGRLIYDGAADDTLTPTGMSGMDIDLTGNDTFFLEDVHVTGSGLTLAVNLYNAATGGVFTSGARLLTDNFSGDVEFEYATFTGEGGEETLSNVGAIEVVVDGSQVAGSDLTIGRLAATGVGDLPPDDDGPAPEEPEPEAPPAVPEPSSLILAGLASIGGLGFRFRRGRKKDEE